MFIKLYPTAQGAITQLYAGTAPEGKDLNGKVTALYSLHGQINAMNRLINCYLDFFTLVSDPVGSSGRTPERGLRRRTEQKIAPNPNQLVSCEMCRVQCPLMRCKAAW